TTEDAGLLAPCDRPGGERQMAAAPEAFLAVAAPSMSAARALEELEGAMAAAWFDEREPALLHVARGTGRPLWVGQGRAGVFFASTKLALEVLEHYCGTSLRKKQVREGTLLALRDGTIVAPTRFKPNHYVEADPLPAVRAPGERETCISRLELLLST